MLPKRSVMELLKKKNISNSWNQWSRVFTVNNTKLSLKESFMHFAMQSQEMALNGRDVVGSRSFQWYKNSLGDAEDLMEKEGKGNAYDIMTQNAKEVNPGSDGLFFLPYLSGERTPHPDPHAKGCFIGMSLRHQKPHLTRAVLEGVSFGLNDSLGLMRNLGIQPSEVQLSGGGTRSALWKQILADIFNTPCSMVSAREGAAYGAAMLASVGSGQHESLDAATKIWIKTIEKINPSKDVEQYQKYYQIYQKIYPRLKETFSEISTIVD